MPEVRRDGVTLYFEDDGGGEPVLLIHGHTMDRRVWEPLLPQLLAADLRVVRPDLRGHGRSSCPNAGYHWTHHAADMRAVIGAIGIGAAHVVGFSIGGGIAIEMAHSMPEVVKGLVLIAPVMPDRPFEPAFMENLREVARVARSAGIEAAMKGPWAASPLFQASLEKPRVRESLADMISDFPGAEYLATARDRIDRPFIVPERLETIGVPTRIVIGELEMAGFRTFADEAASGIPGARIDVLAGSGHLLPLEEPESIARIIIEAASPPR